MIEGSVIIALSIAELRERLFNMESIVEMLQHCRQAFCVATFKLYSSESKSSDETLFRNSEIFLDTSASSSHPTGRNRVKNLHLSIIVEQVVIKASFRLL